jgi:oligopeptide/dipeptide ABC transporter ATP-binding protein
MMNGLSDPLLTVRDLSVSFGAMQAVDAVSFDLGEGETLGIVGESGCGKSTVIQALMRLLDGSGAQTRAASVRFEGEDILALSRRAMTRIRGNRMAMVFQDATASLHPLIRVGDQVQEVLKVHQRLGREAARARTIELFRQVGLGAAEMRMSAYPHELSGGMCQRVMIAMAIACSPRLLLADEPTTALDVTVQAQIIALLRETTRSTGMAMILISHDFGVIASIADRIAVMYAGSIVEIGAADALFANPVHPYTRALLRSIPALDGNTEQDLYVIAGSVEPSEGAAGCLFAQRCPSALHRCFIEKPQHHSVAPAHSVACWLDVSENA